jgi:hypothetical protein
MIKPRATLSLSRAGLNPARRSSPSSGDIEQQFMDLEQPGG